MSEPREAPDIVIVVHQLDRDLPVSPIGWFWTEQAANDWIDQQPAEVRGNYAVWSVAYGEGP